VKKRLFYGILSVLGLAIIGFLSQSHLQKHQQKHDPEFNVIIIGWDGVQRDHFWQCYNKELPECPDGLPHIKELSKGKIFNNVITNGATYTKPGWAQILSGYDAEVMGIWDNNYYQPLPEGYSVFEKLEKHFGDDNIVTLFVSGKDRNVDAECPGEKVLNRDGTTYIKKKGKPWCLIKRNLDYFKNGLHENKNVGKEALRLLEKYKNKRFFAFFHFESPDRACHFPGENTVQYSLEIIDDDRWLGEIVARLKRLGIYKQTLIYVITDHGCNEDGKGGPKHTQTLPMEF